MNPVVALDIGVLFRGEHVSLRLALGAAVVVAAVAVDIVQEEAAGGSSPASRRACAEALGAASSKGELRALRATSRSARWLQGNSIQPLARGAATCSPLISRAVSSARGQHSAPRRRARLEDSFTSGKVITAVSGDVVGDKDTRILSARSAARSKDRRQQRISIIEALLGLPV